MTESRIYFSYGSEEFVKGIAKKHTESDITIYGRKDGDDTMTIFYPAKFPDKIQSLTDSIFLSQCSIIGTGSIDRALGEVIIASDLLEKKNGYLLTGEGTDTSLLDRLLKNSVMEGYEKFTGRSMEFLSKPWNGKNGNPEGPTSIIIDHFFQVKSVGTVALGFVLSGTAKKHQNLYLNPSGKTAQIKSIQMNDIDVEFAPAGSRVGLALKNVDVDQLERGNMLEEEKRDATDSIEGEIIFHRAVPEPLRSDGEVFLAGHLRYQRGFMAGGNIKMDKPILPEGEYLLVRPNSKPRIIGKIRNASF